MSSASSATSLLHLWNVGIVFYGFISLFRRFVFVPIRLALTTRLAVAFGTAVNAAMGLVGWAGRLEAIEGWKRGRHFLKSSSPELARAFSMHRDGAGVAAVCRDGWVGLSVVGLGLPGEVGDC